MIYYPIQKDKVTFSKNHIDTDGKYTLVEVVQKHGGEG